MFQFLCFRGINAIFYYKDLNYAFLGFLFLNLIIVALNKNIKNINFQYKDTMINFQDHLKNLKKEIETIVEEKIAPILVENKLKEEIKIKQEVYKDGKS